MKKLSLIILTCIAMLNPVSAKADEEIMLPGMLAFALDPGFTGQQELAYASMDANASLSFADDPMFLLTVAEPARPRARPAEFLEKVVLPLQPRTMRGQTEETCLQLAIYHEARGESEKGQRAVASVVLQRVAVKHRWGSSVCAVVSPVNFSFVRKSLRTPPIREWDAWVKAGEIAHEMIARGPLPALKGADHYHTTAASPRWRLAMPVVDRIGSHIFYADPMSQT